MRYIGSKTNLLENIKRVIDSCCGAGNKSFCDLFSGTGTVSRFFKPYYQIISNDLLYFSYLLTEATIENRSIPRFEKLSKKGIKDPMEYLESVSVNKIKTYFIAKAYSPYGQSKRMYFTEENAMRIDFIRTQIETWKEDNLIDTFEYKYLLACLIEGVPFVSNITGTYGAYLKHWDKRAFKPFEMCRLQVIDNGHRNISFNEDANDLIKRVSGDILYLDPPYNERQYLPNYHVLETIAKYDNPELAGITGMRSYKNMKSAYCIKSNAEQAFDNLISEADFKHIIVSYSDDGLLSIKNITDILKKHCKNDKIILTKIPYLRYKGKLPQKQKNHFEYIVYAKKQKDTQVYYRIAKIPAWQAKSPPEPKWETKKQFIKSPMNYIGGKHKILPQLFKYFPTKISTFVDLFAGGFNVAVNIKANKIICNDINYKVVEMVRLFCYADINSVLNRVKEKINEYGLSKNNEKGYKDFRDYYNSASNPIDLFTLSCFSFNYQFRFNNNLEYNNPFGKNRSCFSEVTEKNLILFMNEMKQKNIEFYARDFREMNIANLSSNDFIYCDPPYLITTGTYNDGNRGFKDWKESEEKDLHSFLDKANKKNIRFALSNVFKHKDTENCLLMNWAKKYKINYIKNNYSNCNYQLKERESKTIEVLVTNY
jgi:adenine-specific DNA-methyltransferase